VNGVHGADLRGPQPDDAGRFVFFDVKDLSWPRVQDRLMIRCVVPRVTFAALWMSAPRSRRQVNNRRGRILEIRAEHAAVELGSLSSFVLGATVIKGPLPSAGWNSHPRVLSRAKLLRVPSIAPAATAIR